MTAAKLYRYECKNPKCNRTYALPEVVLTGTLNRDKWYAWSKTREDCVRTRVVEVMVDRKTVRKQVVHYKCGLRQCLRSREDICHCGTPFDWPTQSADVSRDDVSPEFQDLLDRMMFDDDFAHGVRKIARDYSKGLRQGMTGSRVVPETIELEVELTFRSHYPVVAAEIVADGAVVHRQGFSQEGAHDGVVRCELFAERDGWVAARLWGDARDSFDQPVYAHTSPTYFRCGSPPAERAVGARFFLDSIDESLKWIDTVGRYNSDQQRSEVKELFRRGREVFAALVG